MKPYSIRFTDEGLQDVKELPKNVRNHLKKKILERIGKDPNGCSDELKPPLEKFRSCHLGDYRVVFYVAEDIRSVAIAGIGKHSKETAKDVYKKLESLISQGKLAEKILATLRAFTAPKH
ncbi:MAG: type II toxin-antitoxin system RelE/ParE family toxin [Acidobacteria bacterium]|nr:type II toxin-antitoxin system RelE/ParE family toxin [Acidobacteriota bacterium]